MSRAHIILVYMYTYLFTAWRTFCISCKSFYSCFSKTISEHGKTIKLSSDGRVRTVFPLTYYCVFRVRFFFLPCRLLSNYLCCFRCCRRRRGAAHKWLCLMPIHLYETKLIEMCHGDNGGLMLLKTGNRFRTMEAILKISTQRRNCCCPTAVHFVRIKYIPISYTLIMVHVTCSTLCGFVSVLFRKEGKNYNVDREWCEIK